MRFYAASLVFLVHVIGSILTEYFRIPESQLSVQSPSSAISLAMFLADGHHGVDVFFVISGFLMAKIIGQRHPGWFIFVKRRFLRIYPAFLASLIIATAVYCTQFGHAFKLRDFVLNLVFYNAIADHGITAYNYVTWSLGYEFAFYLVVPLLGLARGPIGGPIAAAAALVAAFFLFDGSYIRMMGLFAGYFIGTIPDRYLSRFARVIPAWSVVACYCLLVVAKNFRPLPYLTFYLALLPLVCMAVICIVYGEGWLNRFFSDALLRKLGTISYSIYLFHPVVIALVMHKGLSWTGAHANPLVAVPFVLVGSIAAVLLVANASYRLFEAPYFKSGRIHGVGKTP